ncbi:HK97 family phage prohead protease [Streptomyces phaeochromogenes]|uniref:HK97 family phage prohead protease n=1 Tax=Streptomyces phaeochromogenes TaxID=1923 RepID=UPI0036AAED40
MSDKSQRTKVTGIVRRAFPVQLEVRAKKGTSNTRTIEGYASVTETPFQMWDWLGPYDEVVRTGAFGKTLAESPQVQLLLNHSGLAMAYTKAGSLRLSEDTTGLAMGSDVNVSRNDVSDMVTAIEDGAVDEMSFAFRVTRQMWSPDYDQRDILEVDLHRGDVSVVNFGANPATSVAPAMRSADFDRLDEQDARALYERLARRFEDPQPDDSGMPLYLAQAAALAL